MKRLRSYENLKFFGFISPWIIGFTVFFLIPFSTAVFFAFTDARLPANVEFDFVGIQNFIDLMKDQIFIKSVGNTLYFVFIGMPIVVTGMLLVAVLLNLDVKGVALFRTFYYLPTLVPIVATVIIWRLVFNSEFGILNALLTSINLPKINWLGGADTIKPVIILMQLWISGSGVLIFLAALKGVPAHLYEAAKLDGAGKIKIFFNVTLPMISPAILFVVVIQTMYNFQMFTEAMLLARGGPNFASYTYVYNVYQTAFTELKFSMAMTQSLVLFVLIFIITVLMLRFSKHLVHYEGEKR